MLIEFHSEIMGKERESSRKDSDAFQKRIQLKSNQSLNRRLFVGFMWSQVTSHLAYWLLSRSSMIFPFWWVFYLTCSTPPFSRVLLDGWETWLCRRNRVSRLLSYADSDSPGLCQTNAQIIPKTHQRHLHFGRILRWTNLKSFLNSSSVPWSTFLIVP